MKKQLKEYKLQMEKRHYNQIVNLVDLFEASKEHDKLFSIVQT